MYIHIGRGNVVLIEDILFITDFDKLTSTERGKKYIDEFARREDIDNPALMKFPTSCIFVERGIEEEEDEEILNSETEEKDKRFLEGGEFFIEDEEEVLKGKNYEKIIGRISKAERQEVLDYIEENYPEINEFYKENLSNKSEEEIYKEEIFFNEKIEKIREILPKYSLFEKIKMMVAFKIKTIKDYGEEYFKYIVKKEGIEYALGFGKLYLYGKKIYYPEKTRLYIYISEYTVSTLYRRIKEEQIDYYVNKEN